MVALRLPEDLVEEIEGARQDSVSQFIVQAIKEKLERYEVERFRTSFKRIAGESNQEVEAAIHAQAEVVLGED